MGILFKSKKEREREERRERRRAFRQAERSVDDVKDRMKKMEKDADKEWDKAREALTAGKKVAAQRALTSYRAAQVLMTKLEQKRWVFEQYLMKMESAGTDAEFAKALAAVNKVTDINPEMVEDVFDEAGELLGEQQDADKFWASVYGKEMEGAEGALEEHVPEMNALMQQLESEAALEISDGTAEKAAGVKDAVSPEQVRDLLEGK